MDSSNPGSIYPNPTGSSRPGIKETKPIDQGARLSQVNEPGESRAERFFSKFLSFLFWLTIGGLLYLGLVLIVSRFPGGFSGELAGAPLWAIIYVPLLAFAEIFNSYIFIGFFLLILLAQGLIAKSDYSTKVYRRSSILAAVLILILTYLSYKDRQTTLYPMHSLLPEYLVILGGMLLLVLSPFLKFRKIFLIAALLLAVTAVLMPTTLKKYLLFINIRNKAVELNPTITTEHLRFYEGEIDKPYKLDDKTGIFVKESSLFRKSDHYIFYIFAQDGKRYDSWGKGGWVDLFNATGYSYRPSSRPNNSTYDLIICDGMAKDCSDWWNLYRDPNWTPSPFKIYDAHGNPIEAY